ncbi:MAG: amidophosphoribosyltransferase, partial [Clostridia bacterium]
MSRQIKEECGIFGIYDKTKQGNIANTVYYGLFALQHRGQEAAGIAVNNNGNISLVKNLGLVSEVFNEKHLSSLQGSFAIGHVRYSAGQFKGVEDAQPINVNYAKGTITVAHNGNITNALALRDALEQKGAIFHSNNDSEIICYLIARASLKFSTIEEAIQNVIPMLKGSFSLLIMT